MDEHGDQTPSGIPALVDRALESEWYEVPGSDVDRAAYALCRLRRGESDWAGARGGDRAVRGALAEADHAALVWLTSRAISYMDESGFPEAVEPAFPDGREAAT